MWTLGYGLFANVSGRIGELTSLATGERWELRPEDLSLVSGLARGLDDAEAAALAPGNILAASGWAHEAPSTYDEALARRLATLDARFDWCARAHDDEVRDAVRAAHASRRQFQRGFAQYAALPETVARRVGLAGTEPRRVLVLGDDDFLAVGLAARGHQVTVLEIDPLIVTLMRRHTIRYPALEILAHDLREPWPVDLRGRFDLFFADPLSGRASLRLFIARGLAALTNEGRGFVCVA
ncbi:MAG: bis-aminopropyl spermidine synthase family protein, partial [Myxococcota bacterium]